MTAQSISNCSSSASSLAEQRLGDLEKLVPKEQALKIQQYIEAHLPKWEAEHQPVFLHASEHPELPRSLQYDPENNTVFIHFNRCKLGDQVVGRGGSKRVTKTMDYKTGEIFARCVTSHLNGIIEEENVRRFNGMDGIIRTIAIHKYKKANEEKRAFLQELMDRSLFFTNVQDLTFEQKSDIARDLLAGIASIHSRGFYHNDMGRRNALISIHPETQKARAALIDFSETSQVPNHQIHDLWEIAEMIKQLYGYPHPELPLGRFFMNLSEGHLLAHDAYIEFCKINGYPNA
jgi:hypothetical protein